MPPQPRVITHAAEAFGSPVRVGILGALGQHGDLTPSDLASLLDVDRATLRGNLRMLEELHVVQGTPPLPERRPGRVVTYSLAEKRVHYLLDSLTRHVGL